ncbi:MAG: efflux RND transporter periplasmic adaptor subunit [Planctomycetota bacterium]|jgi:hypothetical protein
MLIRRTIVVAFLLIVVGPGAARPPQAGRPPLDQRLRGFVVPSRQVELMAAIEEVLREVLVAESDRVEADQLLARMDDRVQRAVVEAAEVRAASTAAIDTATLDVEDAELNFERVSEAFERGAATDLELRRARIDVGRAKASLDAARDSHALNQVNLRLERERLARYEIRAPFPGTIVDVTEEPGAMLTDVDSVVVLADLDTLEAQLNLPSELYGRLEVGREYTLLAQTPVDRELTARLGADARGPRAHRPARHREPDDRHRQRHLPVHLHDRQPRREPARRLHGLPEVGVTHSGCVAGWSPTPFGIGRLAGWRSRRSMSRLNSALSRSWWSRVAGPAKPLWIRKIRPSRLMKIVVG